MDGLEVGQLIVIGIDTNAEEQARIPAVDDLRAGEVLADERGGGMSGRGRGGAELDEVGLVFLVSRGYEAMDLDCQSASMRDRRETYFAFQADLLFIIVRGVPFR